MTVRHLDLLRSAPKPPPRPPEVSPRIGIAVLAALATGAGLLVWLSIQEGRQLHQRMAAAEALARRIEAAPGPQVDPTVLAALERSVLAREALATALTGERPVAGVEGGGAAPPSQWMAALAATGGGGVSIDSVRLEPGARLGITGSALQTSEVNAFVDRLQQHALTGRVAIGKLEMHAADKPGEAPVRFVLVPAGTAPEAPR